MRLKYKDNAAKNDKVLTLARCTCRGRQPCNLQLTAVKHPLVTEFSEGREEIQFVKAAYSDVAKGIQFKHTFSRIDASCASLALLDCFASLCRSCSRLVRTLGF